MSWIHYSYSQVCCVTLPLSLHVCPDFTLAVQARGVLLSFNALKRMYFTEFVPYRLAHPFSWMQLAKTFANDVVLTLNRASL